MSKKMLESKASKWKEIFEICGLCMAAAGMGMFASAIPAIILVGVTDLRWAGWLVVTAGILLCLQKLLDTRSEDWEVDEFSVAVGGMVLFVAEVVGGIVYSYAGVLLWGVCGLILGGTVASLINKKKPQKPPLTADQRAKAAARQRAERESRESEERIKRLAQDYYDRL